MTKEDLDAIRLLLKEEMQPMRDEIKTINEKLDVLQESSDITRSAVNTLVEWADNVSVITQIKFPVEKTRA